MTEEDKSLEVADDEQLARFILYSSYIRNKDQTVRPNAFIPYPYPDLSVTRHLSFSEGELWNAGQNVADAASATLHGRADFHVAAARRQSLQVFPDPTPNNQNHANIIGWPENKPAQKIIAIELAASSIYKAKP